MGAIGSEDWQFDRFDDGSLKILGEVQLRKYGNFMDEYATQLHDIQTALGESSGDAWDMTLDPLSLQLLPYEQTSLLQLIRTDNKVLNKVLIALGALCCEMDTLQHEATTKFFPSLLFYGEGKHGSEEEAASSICMGQMVAFFQELSCFVHRCYEVIKQVLQQLSALYTSSKMAPRILNVDGVHLLVVYENLGALLTVLITLDQIIVTHPCIKEQFIQYKRVVKSVRHNPARFGLADSKLPTFEKLLMTLEGQLLDGFVFQRCVEQIFDDGKVTVTKNPVFADEFLLNINEYFSSLENRVGEYGETDHRYQLVACVSLFVLHYQLFRVQDKKLFKTMWEMYKKVAVVTLVADVPFFLNDFMMQKCPVLAQTLDKKALSLVQQSRDNWLQQKAQNITKELQSFQREVNVWLVAMENAHMWTNTILDDLNQRCQLLVMGGLLAYQMSHLARTCLNLHAAMGRPMGKSVALATCRFIELIKVIQMTFHRRSMLIADSFNHVIQHLSFLTLSTVVTAKKKLTSEKKYGEQKLDVLSALLLVESMLDGPGTRERRLVAKLALGVALQMKIFKSEELATLQNLFEKMEFVSEFQLKLQAACDCSFMYHHRSLFPVYLSDLFTCASEVQRCVFLVGAMGDCVPSMSQARHLKQPDDLVEFYQQEIMDQIKENLLRPLCRAIETDLRLHTHLHLQQDDRNPFRVSERDLRSFTTLPPLQVFHQLLDIKAYVEHYLDRTFYNLTTVALHDWKTYGDMRNLAYQKYGLELMEAHLPSQTLEQGLDVLEIMRNINVFVSKFLYNLNNQVFVEKSSNNKHLNTINIRHIANSIRTHGTGIMNTTVNFTYQYLRKKFFVFSQFMYDEHIKSRLIKDIRYFRENHLHTNQKYPYERADKFNRGIRKLGVSKDGLSYLDQFRILISHIGNAMGYIRLIRSSGLHCCSNAIRFVPDLEDIVVFEDLCKEEGLSLECQQAARHLDAVLTNLSKNFAEGTEYFQMLVDVFAHEFRSAKNMHLRNFYIILPPLTLNYVEYMITSKEKLHKKNKAAAAFTDDGFAMGLAYILKLLDQYQEFDSLHWFQAVTEKYTEDKATMSKQSASSKTDEKLQQTMTLTEKRLETYLQEFQLLQYSLSSARIFFRADKTAAEEREERAAETPEATAKMTATA